MLQEGSRAPPQPQTPWHKLLALFLQPSRSDATRAVWRRDVPLGSGAPRLMARQRPVPPATPQSGTGPPGSHAVVPTVIASQRPGTAQAVVKRGRTLMSAAKVEGVTPTMFVDDHF